ncbi:MAG: exodeoxyribonuclease V subunit alpha [Desulfomicrobium apsheronum]|nr:exodeoxyribonuclease V subunit alpha [Desulfomicrobium apsheronum]
MFANPAILPRLAASGLFTDADLYQARFAASLARAGHEDMVAALTALTSLAVREGHVCLDLADPQVIAHLTELVPNASAMHDLPDSDVITDPKGQAPLILSGTRLYFSRFFNDEQTLAHTFLRLAQTPAEPLPPSLQADIFKTGRDEIDWQAVACFAALRNRFCVISGGPGTGKTTTVARILKMAARMHAGRDFVIRLAAPTGKAASRLTEALATAFPGGTLPPELAACMNQGAQTVHRLLGWSAGGFRHNQGNRLALDMLVVDEASMLDLELTARLMEALPEHARLVLLGDRNQLASVEAGAVLANLCREEAVNAFSDRFAAAVAETCTIKLPVTQRPAPLADHVVELKKSYRFGPDSGIAALSELIRDGKAQEAAALLEERHADLEMIHGTGPKALEASVAPLLREAFGELGGTNGPARAFEIFAALRLLSPIRKGPRGTEALNRLAGQILVGQAFEAWYPGRPVMILENDYNLGLFNGDVGIALSVDGQLRIFFPGAEGFTSFSPARLPRHETCYAMTVHKSQGSEFGHTVLVLPEEPCQVLGRELLYTALTRAKKRFTLLGTPRQVKDAVQNPARRDSGLGEMLAQRKTQA